MKLLRCLHPLRPERCIAICHECVLIANTMMKLIGRPPLSCEVAFCETYACRKMETRLKTMKKGWQRSESPSWCTAGVQAAYGELQQRCGALTSEVERLQRSPAPATGPRSVDPTSGGDASTRLRQMHEQLAQQELQLTSARAENQVPPPRLS